MGISWCGGERLFLTSETAIGRHIAGGEKGRGSPSSIPPGRRRAWSSQALVSSGPRGSLGQIKLGTSWERSQHTLSGFLSAGRGFCSRATRVHAQSRHRPLSLVAAGPLPSCPLRAPGVCPGGPAGGGPRIAGREPAASEHGHSRGLGKEHPWVRLWPFPHSPREAARKSLRKPGRLARTDCRVAAALRAEPRRPGWK